MLLVATIMDSSILDTQKNLLVPPPWILIGLKKVPKPEQSFTPEMSTKGIKRRGDSMALVQRICYYSVPIILMPVSFLEK